MYITKDTGKPVLTINKQCHLKVFELKSAAEARTKRGLW